MTCLPWGRAQLKEPVSKVQEEPRHRGAFRAKPQTSTELKTTQSHPSSSHPTLCPKSRYSTPDAPASLGFWRQQECRAQGMGLSGGFRVRQEKMMEENRAGSEWKKLKFSLSSIPNTSCGFEQAIPLLGLSLPI